jgi:peptidoglycan/xylan/chitin deacetylase (PgdA/CDA1 family)
MMISNIETHSNTGNSRIYLNRTVTIVMYHYVRDLERSRYPRIKGLSVDRFRNQLAHIESQYSPISAEELLDAVASPHRRLPENAILLTFDDGYSDHFDNVLPLLQEKGMKACFFPMAKAILDGRVLDVNKIQFILAAVENVWPLIDEVFEALDEFRGQYSLKSREAYLMTVTDKHRYDPREVTIFKRLLQRELPEAVRSELVDRLFKEYVTANEAEFAAELYMSLDQVGQLHETGMHVGSHGYSHAWLNHLSPAAQQTEIDLSLGFLRRAGIPLENWTMCYPYGGFDDSLLDVLRGRECKLGFTVEARVADLERDGRLTLPRIDTNDLPS